MEKPDVGDLEFRDKLYIEEKNKYFYKFREMVEGEDIELGRKAVQAIKYMMMREEHYGFGTLYSYDSLNNLPK